VDLFIDEAADILVRVQIKLHEKIVTAGRRIDFGSDLGIGYGGGDVVSLAKLAFDLNEKRLHATRFLWVIFYSCSIHLQSINQLGTEGKGALIGFAKEEPIMRHFKSIFQAAILSGALALGAATAAQAAPLAQAPTPATVDLAKGTSNIIAVYHTRRHARWCNRHPRACNRRYANRRYWNRRYYNRRYYPGYAYYPRHYYRPYYSPYYYDYGYYGRPRVGLWFGF
jgi:hypothetical protein